MVEHSTRVRERLGALPEIPLPDTLWQRVEMRHRQKVRRRKLGIGLATFALVAVMATPLLIPVFTGANVGQDKPTVTLLRPAPALRDIQAEVRALDHALQMAYNRGASDAEIAPMWVARDALLASTRSSTSATSKPDRT